MKKNSVYKAHRNVFLLGIMILFSLFLMDFASAFTNVTYQENFSDSEFLFTGSWYYSGKAIDGIWSGTGTGYWSYSKDIDGYYYFNYTKPAGSNSSTLLVVKDHLPIRNHTIPIGCWDSLETKLVFRALSSAGGACGVIWYCQNGTDWYEINRSCGDRTIYEEAIYWVNGVEGESDYIIYLLNATDNYNFTSSLNITGTNYSYEWKNATYNTWFSNGTLFNSTLVEGLSGNNTIVTLFLDDFSFGNYIWNVYGCYDNSTFGGCVWSSNNYTFQYVPFSNTGESYSLSTYETKNETFYLNISTASGTSNMGAFLVYNGTSYAAEHSCSGTTCQIWRKIDIPLVTTTGALNENKSFYWSITLFGTFGTSTTTTTPINQNVTNLLFSNSGCSPGYNASINFTIYNETSQALINSDFKSTFNFWLGEGTVKDSYNFSGSGHNHYLFCVSHNQSYITNSEIELTSGVNTRLYQFIKQIYDNTLKIQKLFIPDSAFISNIIIEVKNQGLVPEEDITVKISRYYPEYDEYEVVETKITDEFGQIIAKLVENNVIYKFGFYDSNGTLLKESDKVTVICRSTICVIPFIIETTDDYLDRYENLTLFDYELSFDNSTNIVTYAWDDQRGESATYRLEVVRYAFNESTLVCNTTSTTSVSSLTCNVGSNPSSYTIQIFRQVDGEEERRISYLQIIVGDYSSTFVVEGLFWVFILLMICVGIGVYDPKVGAVLYGVGFIFMGILKIIYMPLPVFFANTLLVILFVWAVKT